MSEFNVIGHDVGGVNDNCIWELDKAITSDMPILNFASLCPSGATFLQRNSPLIKDYI